MDINDVDRYDEAAKRLIDLEKEFVQRMADAKEEAIATKMKALLFIGKLPNKGTSVIRALSGNFYVSDGASLKLADNVIISAEDLSTVEEP
jgi:hypothetical protein